MAARLMGRVSCLRVYIPERGAPSLMLVSAARPPDRLDRNPIARALRLPF